MVSTAAEVLILLRARDEASGAIRGMSANTGSALTNLGNIAAQTTQIFAGLGAAMIGFAAKAGFSFNNTIEQAQIGFERFYGSATKAKAVLEELVDFAKVTPFEAKDVINAARAVAGYGFAAEDTIPMLRTLGDASAATGGDILLMLKALGQIKTAGRVYAQEMNQLANQNIFAWQYLADAAGVSIQEIRKIAETEGIEANSAIKAILFGIDKDYGGLMQRMETSFIGRLNRLRDTFNQFAGVAFKPLFDQTSRFMARMADALDSPIFQLKAAQMVQRITGSITGALIPAANILKQAFFQIMEAIETIGPVAMNVFSIIRQAIETASGPFKIIVDKVNELTGGNASLAATIGVLVGLFAALALSMLPLVQIAVSLGGLVGGFAAIGVVVSIISENFGELALQVGKTLAVIVPLLLVFGGLAGMVPTILAIGGAIFGIVSSVAVLGPLLGSVAAILAGAFGSGAATVFSSIGASIGAAGLQFQILQPLIWGIWGAFNAVGSIGSLVVSAISSIAAAGLQIGFLQPIIWGIWGALQAIGLQSAGISAVFSALSSAAAPIAIIVAAVSAVAVAFVLLKDGADSAKSTLDSITSTVASVQATLLSLVGAFIVFDNGKMAIAAAAGAIVGLLIPAVIALSGAVAGLVVAALPFLAISLAAAAVGVGIYLLVTRFDQVKAKAQELGDSLSNVFSGINDSLKNAGLEGFDESLSRLGSNLTLLGTSIISIFGQIKSALSNIFSNLMDVGVFDSILASIQTAAPLLIASLSAVFSVLASLVGVIAQVAAAFEALFSGDMEGFLSHLGQAFGQLVLALGQAAVAIGLFGAALGTIALGALGSIGAFIEGIGQSIQDFGHKMQENGGIVSAVVGTIIANIGVLVSTFGSVFQNIVSIIQNAFSLIVNIIQGDWQAALGNLQNIGSDILNIFTALPEAMFEIGKNIVQGLLNGLQSAWGSVTGWASDAVGGLISSIGSAAGVNSPSTYTLEIGDQLAQGLIIGFNEGVAQFSPAEPLQQAVNEIESFVPTFESAGDAMGNAYAVGLQQAMATGSASAIRQAFAMWDSYKADLISEANTFSLSLNEWRKNVTASNNIDGMPITTEFDFGGTGPGLFTPPKTPPRLVTGVSGSSGGGGGGGGGGAGAAGAAAAEEYKQAFEDALKNWKAAIPGDIIDSSNLTTAISQMVELLRSEITTAAEQLQFDMVDKLFGESLVTQFGDAGAKVIEAFTKALADGSASSASSITGFVDDLVKQLVAAGVPGAANAGTQIMEALIAALQSGSAEAIAAAAAIIKGFTDQLDTAASKIKTFGDAWNEAVGKINLKESVGSTGASIVEIIGNKIDLDKPETLQKLAGFGTQILEQLRQTMDPARANALGGQLMAAISRAITEGTPEALEALKAFLAQINTILQGGGIDEATGKVFNKTQIENIAKASGLDDEFIRDHLGIIIESGLGKFSAGGKVLLEETKKIIDGMVDDFLNGKKTIDELIAAIASLIRNAPTVKDDSKDGKGGSGGSGSGSSGSSNLNANSFSTPNHMYSYRMLGTLSRQEFILEGIRAGIIAIPEEFGMFIGGIKITSAEMFVSIQEELGKLNATWAAKDPQYRYLPEYQQQAAQLINFHQYYQQLLDRGVQTNFEGFMANMRRAQESVVEALEKLGKIESESSEQMQAYLRDVLDRIATGQITALEAFNAAGQALNNTVDRFGDRIEKSMRGLQDQIGNPFALSHGPGPWDPGGERYQWAEAYGQNMQQGNIFAHLNLQEARNWTEAQVRAWLESIRHLLSPEQYEYHFKNIDKIIQAIKSTFDRLGQTSSVGAGGGYRVWTWNDRNSGTVSTNALQAALMPAGVVGGNGYGTTEGSNSANQSTVNHITIQALDMESFVIGGGLDNLVAAIDRNNRRV